MNIKGVKNASAKTDIPAWKPKLLLTKAVLPYPAYGRWLQNSAAYQERKIIKIRNIFSLITVKPTSPPKTIP
jgi:hypothetical protein